MALPETRYVQNFSPSAGPQMGKSPHAKGDPKGAVRQSLKSGKGSSTKRRNIPRGGTFSPVVKAQQ